MSSWLSNTGDEQVDGGVAGSSCCLTYVNNALSSSNLNAL